MCHTRSATVQSGQPGTGVPGSARRAAASRRRRLALQVSRYSAALHHHDRTTRARGPARRARRHHVAVVLGELVLPRVLVGHVHRLRAERSTGITSLRTELPIMQKRSGADADVGEHAGVCRLVLLADDVDVDEVVGEAGHLDLALLVHEVALGDDREAVVRAEVREHLVATSGISRTGSVSIAMPGRTTSPITVAGTAPCVPPHGALDHRQRERLHAVPGDRHVAAFGRPQRVAQVDAVGDVRSRRARRSASRRATNESSLCHSVSSASNPMTSKLVDSSLDRVQVVVDGDPADPHRVGDVLHGAAQHERALLLEQADGALLVLAGRSRRRPPSSDSTFSMRRSSAPCSGGMRTPATDVAVPHQGHVATAGGGRDG